MVPLETVQNQLREALMRARQMPTANPASGPRLAQGASLSDISRRNMLEQALLQAAIGNINNQFAGAAGAVQSGNMLQAMNAQALGQQGFLANRLSFYDRLRKLQGQGGGTGPTLSLRGR